MKIVRLKKIMFVFMIMIMSATVFGCSSSTNSTSSSSKTTKQAAQGQIATKVEKVVMPKGQPALIGKVKEIVGNEVTIYKAAVRQNQGAPKESPASQTQSQGNRGFEMKFSEETETFMIPVGAPIVTIQRGSNEGVQVGLTGIKADTTLRIWKTDGTITFVQVMGGSSQKSSKESTDRSQSGNSQGMGGPPPDMGGPGIGGSR